MLIVILFFSLAASRGSTRDSAVQSWAALCTDTLHILQQPNSACRHPDRTSSAVSRNRGKISEGRTDPWI